MYTHSTRIEEYIALLPETRRDAFYKLAHICDEQLIQLGYTPCIQYKMPSRSVSHAIYPDGYHCDPSLPLPFVSLANQKGSINLYHMGIYAQPDLHEWFVTQWPKHSNKKLDMGKSCVRFKYMDEIPYDLIQELLTKISVQQWINLYEKNINK